jgi:hypothetical protein
MFTKLKSMYYIFFKKYQLIWRDESFPDYKKYLGFIYIYDDVIVLPDSWNGKIPEKIAVRLEKLLDKKEKENAKD